MKTIKEELEFIGFAESVTDNNVTRQALKEAYDEDSKLITYDSVEDMFTSILGPNYKEMLAEDE